MYMLELAAELAKQCCRSEGFPRTGYFVLGRDGTGAWQISGVVCVTARAFLLLLLGSLVFLLRFSEVFGVRRVGARLGGDSARVILSPNIETSTEH